MEEAARLKYPMCFPKQAAEIDYVLQHMHREDPPDGLGCNWQSILQVGNHINTLCLDTVDPDIPVKLLDRTTSEVQRWVEFLPVDFKEVPNGKNAPYVCSYPTDTHTLCPIAHLAMKVRHASPDPDGESRILDKAIRIERFAEILSQSRVQLVAHLSPPSAASS